MKTTHRIASLLFVAACVDTGSAPDPAAQDKADGPDQVGLATGTHAWRCSRVDSGTVVAELTHHGSKVVRAAIHDYLMVEDGVQREDSAIGSSVFDVEVGAVAFPSSTELSFEAALRDYSEASSWKLSITAAGAGKLEWTFAYEGNGPASHEDTLRCEDLPASSSSS